MTKKKKIFSFADRANQIKKSYPRAEWDSIERTDMINELKKLREEHEQFRIENGMGDEEQDEVQEQANGGSIYNHQTSQWLRPRSGYTNYATGGDPKPNAWTTPWDNQYSNQNPYVMPTYTTGETTGISSVDPLFSDKSLNLNQSDNVITGDKQPKSLQGIQTSPWATGISTGVSMIGNMAGLIANNKKNRPKDVKLPRMAATEVNMEPQREALRRDYHNAINIALNRSRNASNESNAYANQIGAITGITDSMGSKMNESALSEAQVNAGYRNQASQANLQAGAQEALANKQQAQYYDQLQAGYRDNLFEAIPKGLADYRAQYSQDMMMNTMGKEYGISAIAPENSWQKFIQSISGPRYNINKR